MKVNSGVRSVFTYFVEFCIFHFSRHDNTLHCNATQHSAAQCNAAQRITTQCNANELFANVCAMFLNAMFVNIVQASPRERGG